MTDAGAGNCLAVDIEVELDDFMLEVKFESGQERLVLFGPSGAGKSTLLKTIAGLFRAQHGSIHLNNRTLYDSARDLWLPPQARRIGYVPQQYALFPHLTIAQNIAYGIPAGKQADLGQHVDRWVRLMRLESQAERRPGEVSGGQQQRAALARAMASEPELLLLDEPFAALDQVLRDHLREEIRRVSEQFGLPMIIVTHDPVEAYSISESVVVLHEGCVQQQGEREEVFRSPNTPGLARLLGMSNIFSAEILPLEGQSGVFTVFGKAIEIPGRAMPPGRVQLGIRPEAIEINHSTAYNQAWLSLTGTLLELQASGYDHLLRFRVHEAEETSAFINARVDHRDYIRNAYRLGETYQLSIRAADLHLFPGTKGLD
jgi:molybdate transport system ATP-binding protein